MITQDTLNAMRSEVKQLNEAIRGDKMQAITLELDLVELALSNIEMHCSNLTLILDECDVIQPGIVSNAAMAVYRKVGKDDETT